jgi:dolichol-phosphate mannosyltransferase
LLLFYLLCSIGWFINVQVADALYHLGLLWWGAGILGAMVSAVWNYSMTSAAIWTRRR